MKKKVSNLIFRSVSIEGGEDGPFYINVGFILDRSEVQKVYRKLRKFGGREVEIVIRDKRGDNDEVQ